YSATHGRGCITRCRPVRLRELRDESAARQDREIPTRFTSSLLHRGYVRGLPRRHQESGDDRYRIGEREYHAHCFDISNIGTTAIASTTVGPLSSRSDGVAISGSEAPGALPLIHPGRRAMRNPGWRQNFEGWLRRKTAPALPVPKPARPPRRPRPPRPAPP